MHESPHAITMLAAHSGVNESKWREYLDDSGGADMPAHELEQLPEEIWLALTRPDANAHGWTLAQLPVCSVAAHQELDMLCAAAKDSAEAIAAHAEAMRAPSRATLERLEREATEAIERFAAVRERAKEALAALSTTPIRRGVR